MRVTRQAESIANGGTAKRVEERLCRLDGRHRRKRHQGTERAVACFRRRAKLDEGGVVTDAMERVVQVFGCVGHGTRTAMVRRRDHGQEGERDVRASRSRARPAVV